MEEKLNITFGESSYTLVEIVDILIRKISQLENRIEKLENEKESK